MFLLNSYGMLDIGYAYILYDDQLISLSLIRNVSSHLTYPLRIVVISYCHSDWMATWFHPVSTLHGMLIRSRISWIPT